MDMRSIFDKGLLHTKEGKFFLDFILKNDLYLPMCVICYNLRYGLRITDVRAFKNIFTYLGTYYREKYESQYVSEYTIYLYNEYVPLWREFINKLEFTGIHILGRNNNFKAIHGDFGTIISIVSNFISNTKFAPLLPYLVVDSLKHNTPKRYIDAIKDYSYSYGTYVMLSLDQNCFTK